MLKPQRDVPVPKAIQPERPRKYPFETLEVGEMFFIPGRARNNMAAQAWTQGKKLKRVFTTRLLYMRETKKGWVPCDADHLDSMLGVGVWRMG